LADRHAGNAEPSRRLSWSHGEIQVESVAPIDPGIASTARHKVARFEVQTVIAIDTIGNYCRVNRPVYSQ